MLAWALGAIDLDALPFPDELVEAPAVVEVAAFQADLRLRPAAAILDALDLTFRAHWAINDARVRGDAPPAGVITGVVAERHHALNWLTRFEDADWDDVTTPT